MKLLSALMLVLAIGCANAPPNPPPPAPAPVVVQTPPPAPAQTITVQAPPPTQVLVPVPVPTPVPVPAPPPASSPPLACDGAQQGYTFLRGGIFTIHQNGTTSYGKGQHPDIAVSACVEGNRNQCWPLNDGGAMNDVVSIALGPGDRLVLYHNEGGGNGRVRADNCAAGLTYNAIFRQGGTGATFDVR